MDIAIYQIIEELDYDELMFKSYQYAITKCKGKIRAELYEAVFYGEVQAKSPEEVFNLFNKHIPKEYKGRSMAISDVIEIKKSPVDSEFYYCNNEQFIKIDFDKREAMSTIVNHNFDKINIHRENVSIFYISNNGLEQRKCKTVDVKRCRYSQSRIGYRIEFETTGVKEEHSSVDFAEKPMVIVSKCIDTFPVQLLYVNENDSIRMRYGAHSRENLDIVGTWLYRKGFDYGLLL